MLQQDRINLHADAKAQSARLLDREVSYIRSQMSTMATISTFLGGFLYSQISSGFELEDNIVDGISKEFLILAFMCNLSAVVASVLLQVFGPYAALKADPQKLAFTIRKIRAKRRMVLRLFVMGIFSFEISTMALIWAKWDHNYAVFATIVIALFDLYMHKIYTSMQKAFMVPSLMPRLKLDNGCCAGLCNFCGCEDRHEDDEWENTMFTIDYEKNTEGGDLTVLMMQAKHEGLPLGEAGQSQECEKCQNVFPLSSKFCTNCGNLSSHRCQQCHALLVQSASGKSMFCSACGMRHNSTKSKKEKLPGV